MTRWDQMRERSNLFWLLLLVVVARVLGRGIARLVLIFVVGYFLIGAGTAVVSSRDFLRRALQREPRAADVFRHFYSFAAVMLDRFFLMAGKSGKLNVVVHRPPEVARIGDGNRGCLLLVSHLGSFEVMRTPGLSSRRLPLRVLMDRNQGAVFTRLLERLNPDLAASIIDASQRGPALVLALREALEKNCMVCMMADRTRAGDRTVAAQFLGSPVKLPASPWILASTLKVPVILAFGLYRGGANYDLHFELFDEKIDVPRERREPALREYAQRYAARLEHYAKALPYNWFNFYDFFADDPPAH